MFAANFSMQELLGFGIISTSKFHVNIKKMEEFMKDLLARVSFLLILLLPEGENQI